MYTYEVTSHTSRHNNVKLVCPNISNTREEAIRKAEIFLDEIRDIFRKDSEWCEDNANSFEVCIKEVD